MRAWRAPAAGAPTWLRIFLEIQVRAALAGNNLDGPVRALLLRVAAALGISRVELAHIEAVLRIQRGGFRARRSPGAAAGRAQQADEAYRVLETHAPASDEEVVKAYRRQLTAIIPTSSKPTACPSP